VLLYPDNFIYQTDPLSIVEDEISDAVRGIDLLPELDTWEESGRAGKRLNCFCLDRGGICRRKHDYQGYECYLPSDQTLISSLPHPIVGASSGSARHKLSAATSYWQSEFWYRDPPCFSKVQKYDICVTASPTASGSP
jgi:hypothetical protein